MSPRSVAALLIVALFAGCAPTQPPTRGDVMVDGVSILGAWQAAEVVGDDQATLHLEDGTTEHTLIVSSNGRVVLMGVDHRDGAGPVSSSGRITGNRIEFVGVEGIGTLFMSGRRLMFRDPTGRSLAFVRTDGR